MARPKRGEGGHTQKRAQNINKGNDQERVDPQESKDSNENKEMREKKKYAQDAINDYYNKTLKQEVQSGEKDQSDSEFFKENAVRIRDVMLERAEEGAVDLENQQTLSGVIEEIVKKMKNDTGGFSFEGFNVDHVRPKEGQNSLSEAERFINETIQPSLLEKFSEKDIKSVAQDIGGRLEVAADGVESGQVSADEEVKNVRDLTYERMLPKVQDTETKSELKKLLGEEVVAEDVESGVELNKDMGDNEIAQKFLVDAISKQDINADITPEITQHFVESYGVQVSSAMERLKTSLAEDNEKMRKKAADQMKSLAESYFKQKFDQFEQAA